MLREPRTTVGRSAIGAPSEDLLRFYAEVDQALPDPVFVVGFDGRILYMGASFEAITGIPAKSAIGQPAINFIHEDDRVSARAVFDRFWTMSDSRLVYEARAVTATGEPRWLSASIRVTEWSRDERVLVGTLRDVTPHRGEVSPGALSSDLRFVLDALPGIAYAMDASGDITYSTAALRATMYRGATSDGARDWLTQLHPDDAPAVRTAHRTGTERRMPFDVVGRLPRTDGAFRWFRLVATPRFDVAGTFLGHLVFLHDESVVREAEASMRAQERTLVRLLDTMVVAVAVAAPDGTLLFTNEPCRKLVEAGGGNGVFIQAMKGEVEVLDERGRALDRDDWPMVRVRRTRVPQLDCRIGFRREGWERYFRANFVPVPHGHPAWPAGSVVSSWEEITAEREAQRTALRLESEASARRATEDVLRSMTVIANATDALARVYVQQPDLHAVAAALAPDFADVIRLVLFDASSVTADAVAAGPEVGAVAMAREREWPVASVFHPMRSALESGRTQFVANVASDDWPRWYPDGGGAPVVGADAPSSLIAVPVRHADAVCGALLAIRTVRGNRPFTERDVAVAEGFASTLGIFTDRLAVWRALEAELQERRQIQEQLKASEETFRVAATTVTELVFSVDIATGHCHFGTAGSQLIGNAVDADYRTMMSRWLRRVHADDRARVVAHIRSLADDAVDEATVEYRMRDMAGAERWVYQRIAVVRDGLGFPVRLVGALRDETEERVTRDRLAADRARLAEIVEEQTRELSQANADLSRSARLKDEFLASMSHELRTPVNAVLGIGEALGDGVFGPVVDRQREALRDLVDSGQHLLGLINDILDLSKIAAGRMDPIVEPTNVTEACDAAVRVVQQQAFEKGLKLRADLPPGGSYLNTDQRWLRQILVNLLGNAVKFTPSGGAIALEVVEEPIAIAFTVRDTGIGIAAEDMDRLFQPFVQLDQGLSRRQGGTGLGLALVRRFVDLLGGTVGVVSEIGKGSAFTLRLPRPDSSTAVGQDATPQPLTVPDSAPMPAGTRGHVLLAEDNAANVRTFVGYLEAKGFHVEVARNGVEAVDLALRTKPGVILMDVQMPEKDGLQAMREIAAALGDDTPPMLALTAFAMPGDRERCLEAGAVAHLPKPVNLKELVATVDHWLRRGTAVA